MLYQNIQKRVLNIVSIFFHYIGYLLDLIVACLNFIPTGTLSQQHGRGGAEDREDEGGGIGE